MRITGTISARFLNPKATCAVCGREVDPEGTTPLAECPDISVQSSAYGREMLLDVTPGELLVICKECEK